MGLGPRGRILLTQPRSAARIVPDLPTAKGIKDKLDNFEELGREQDAHKSSINGQGRDFYELKKKKAKLQRLSGRKEELAKADQTLRSRAGKPVLNGRDRVRQVLQAFSEKGESRNASSERMRREAQKSKMESRLTNSLFQRKDERGQALQENSGEDLKPLEERLGRVKAHLEGRKKNLADTEGSAGSSVKKRKKSQALH